METKRNKIWLIIPALVILGLIIKELIITFIPFRGSIEIIPHVLNLRYIRHYALHLYIWYSTEAWARILVLLFNLVIMKFSLQGKHKNLSAKLMTVITLISLAAIYVYQPYNDCLTLTLGVLTLGGMYYLFPQILENRFIQLAWFLEIAGSIGNLIDQNIRGYVTDYLQFFPSISNLIFNLEDWLIYIGGTLFYIGIMAFGITKIVKWALKAIKGNRIDNLLIGETHVSASVTFSIGSDGTIVRKCESDGGVSR